MRNVQKAPFTSGAPDDPLALRVDQQGEEERLCLAKRSMLERYVKVAKRIPERPQFLRHVMSVKCQPKACEIMVAGAIDYCSHVEQGLEQGQAMDEPLLFPAVATGAAPSISRRFSYICEMLSCVSGFAALIVFQPRMASM